MHCIVVVVMVVIILVIGILIPIPIAIPVVLPHPHPCSCCPHPPHRCHHVDAGQGASVNMSSWLSPSFPSPSLYTGNWGHCHHAALLLSGGHGSHCCRPAVGCWCGHHWSSGSIIYAKWSWSVVNCRGQYYLPFVLIQAGWCHHHCMLGIGVVVVTIIVC